MAEIVPGHVLKFLREMLPERTALLKEMERQCREEYIPLVEPEVGQLLQLLLKIKGAKSVLEIGTGIGYSTILLAQCLATKEKRIITIEIDRKRHLRACDNFEKAGVSGMIRPLCGDANEIIPALEDSFDFIFMDAAKGQYPEFFAKVWPRLEPGGVLIIDNIFLHGWVIEMTWPERRKKTMVCRVRELLETLKDHPELTTTLLPLGDGLAVSVRS